VKGQTYAQHGENMQYMTIVHRPLQLESKVKMEVGRETLRWDRDMTHRTAEGKPKIGGSLLLPKAIRHNVWFLQSSVPFACFL